MKRILTTVFIAFILLLQSCIKEDLSSCRSELMLRFRYTLNDQYTNLFDAEVHHVAVYVFGNDGQYVGSFSQQGDLLTNDYVMRIPLPEGEYSVVAFGGDLTTYLVAELNNEANTLNQMARQAATHINDFRIELESIIGDQNYLYPANTPLDLYAGLAMNAVSTQRNNNITDVELIKDTKKVKVKISGTEAFNSPLEVHITAINGKYKYDNSIDINHGTFKYTPINTVQQPNYLELDLKTMRLVMGQAPILTIKNINTGEILYSENMIGQIMLSPQYSAQTDFDREDEFIFEISVVDNIVVLVSVNGWQINSVNPDIE